MKRLTSAVLVAGALMLANVTPAVAHDNDRSIHNQHYQYRTVNIRSRGVPSWLRHNGSFRSWYSHSGLRTNRYLTWSELYQIYRWERSYPARQYKRSYAYNGHHNYNWYRQYWNSQRYDRTQKRTQGRSYKSRDWDRRH